VEEDLRAVQCALGALLDLSVIREVLRDSLRDLKAPRDVLDARRNNAKRVAAQRLSRFLTRSDSEAAAANAHGVLAPWCSRGDDQRIGAECVGALLFEHAAQVLTGSDCSGALSIGKQLEEASELLEASGMSSRKRAVEHFEVVVKAAAEMDCWVVAEIAARIASSAVRGAAGDASDSTSGAGLQPVANATKHDGAAILSLASFARACWAPSAATSGDKSAEESYRALWGGDEFEASERGSKLRAKFVAQYSDAASDSMPANGVFAPSLPQLRPYPLPFEGGGGSDGACCCKRHGSSDVCTRGLFTGCCTCRHPLPLIFIHLALSESTGVPEKILMSHFPNLNMFGLYAFCCGLQRRVANAAAWVLEGLSLLTDRFHATNHSCSFAFKPASRQSLLNANTVAHEQRNSPLNRIKSLFQGCKRSMYLIVLAHHAAVKNLRALAKAANEESRGFSAEIIDYANFYGSQCPGGRCPCTVCVRENISPADLVTAVVTLPSIAERPVSSEERQLICPRAVQGYLEDGLGLCGMVAALAAARAGAVAALDVNERAKMETFKAEAVAAGPTAFALQVGSFGKRSVELTMQDFMFIRERRWVTDRVVNGYFYLLEQRANRRAPTSRGVVSFTSFF
jgi:hypothetical protein